MYPSVIFRFEEKVRGAYGGGDMGDLPELSGDAGQSGRILTFLSGWLV